MDDETLFKKRIKRNFIFYLVYSLYILLNLLPHSAASFLFSSLALFLFFILKKVRSTMIANLNYVYGISPSHKKFAFQNFLNLSRNAVDFLRLKKLCLNKKIIIRREEIFQNALKIGNGVIFISGHLGAWELIPAYLSEKGYPINVVTRTVYEPKLGNLIDNIRQSKGMNIIDRKVSLKESFKALKRGESLGVLIDQDTGSKGVFIQFLGRRAFTPTGIVKLAMKTKSSVIPMAIHRERDSHIIDVDHPLKFVLTGNKEMDIMNNTALCSNAVEKFIRTYPEEWVWMHRRWKRKPDKRKDE